jgi:hypothetical protein
MNPDLFTVDTEAMNIHEERRSSTRMLFTPRAYGELTENGREFCGTIRDISMRSLFIKLDNNSELSGPCDIQIVIEGNHSELEINNLRGKIVRTDADGIAIQLDKRLEWFAIVPLYFRKAAK